MNYFVAALPRSRTAWLSVFLSQSGIHCLHDGMNGCASIEEYMVKLGDFGDSSTGIAMFDIEVLYPNCPIVIIEKNEKELRDCIEWCDLIYGGNNEAEIIRQQKLIDKMPGMRIKQSEINVNLEAIFTYLTGCEWKPIYADIKKLNIQSDPYAIDIDAAERLMLEAIQ